MNLLWLCLLMTGLQAPAQPPAKPGNPPAAQEGFFIDFYSPVQVEAKTPATLEQAIAQALVNHPDMRLVEAELRVAEAKLAQARIQISQKVTEDFHRLQKERADVELAQANWERMTQLLKSSAISQEEYKVVQHQLAAAKARLAATESSWKLMLGKQVMKVEQLVFNDYLDVRRQEDNTTALGQLYRQNARAFAFYGTERFNSDTGTPNSIDQLKNHLEAKVKLDKQTNLDLEQAFQKVTEGAGVKVRVKLPITENKTLYKGVTHLDLDASEYPLHTWLQLIMDEMNTYQAMAAPQRQETPKRFDLYVREYGLLLTSRDLAPSDAITVQELWKQVQFEKAAKEAKKSQENAPSKK